MDDRLTLEEWAMRIRPGSSRWTERGAILAALATREIRKPLEVQMRPRRLLAWLAGLTLRRRWLRRRPPLPPRPLRFTSTSPNRAPKLTPVPGALGTLTIALSGVLHATDLQDGTVHSTVITTGTVTFAPDDPSQPSFAGHLAESQSDQINSRNAITTNAENVVVHGSDGSLGKQHILIHHTVNADGTMTSSVEIVEFTCLAP